MDPSEEAGFVMRDLAGHRSANEAIPHWPTLKGEEL
jgi:hypothetical protein